LLLTAGGSAYFDLAARLLRAVEHPRLLKVLRSGCYVSHDHGVYDEQLVRAVARDATCGLPDLRPALEVWASVLSRPEPGLAIINAGKRDLGCDVDYPFVRQHYRAATMPAPVALAGAELFQMSDQHGFVRLPEGADVAVGDLLGLGVSHPCTTFDKWPVLLEVDDGYRVAGAIRSYF
jgi:D-serine dehydratase